MGGDLLTGLRFDERLPNPPSHPTRGGISILQSGRHCDGRGRVNWSFAGQCARVLRPGGRLLVATDVADYAALVRELVAAQTPLRELPPPAEHEPGHDLAYLTNFERKFRKEGKPIYRLAYEKP